MTEHLAGCHSRRYLRSPFCTCKPRRWWFSRRPKPEPIVATFPYIRGQIGFFTQEWIENDCLMEIRNRAEQKDIDITGRRISYAWAGLDGGQPDDTVTLTVTVHG